MTEIINVSRELTQEQKAAVEKFAEEILRTDSLPEVNLWETYDKVYQFEKCSGNRKVSKGHVSQIKQGFIENLPYLSAIIVNSRSGNVIDGQHRLKAFLDLCEKGKLNKDEARLLVRYIDVDEETERRLIIDMNCKSKNWSLNDYISCYSLSEYRNGGNQYHKLVEWCENHRLEGGEEGREIGYRYAAAIIKGKNCSKELKNNTFAATDEEWEQADERFNEITSIIDHMGLEQKGCYIEGLALAWYTKREETLADFGDFDTFLENLGLKEMDGMPTSTQRNWEAVFDKAFRVYSREQKQRQALSMAFAPLMEIKELESHN